MEIAKYLLKIGDWCKVLLGSTSPTINLPLGDWNTSTCLCFFFSSTWLMRSKRHIIKPQASNPTKIMDNFSLSTVTILINISSRFSLFFFWSSSATTFRFLKSHEWNDTSFFVPNEMLDSYRNEQHYITI